ncbi:hypothetical protein COO60DRAFT_1474555, partial [Scenedesmus sp. NREL 46B-D3]
MVTLRCVLHPSPACHMLTAVSSWRSHSIQMVTAATCTSLLSQLFEMQLQLPSHAACSLYARVWLLLYASAACTTTNVHPSAYPAACSPRPPGLLAHMLTAGPTARLAAALSLRLQGKLSTIAASEADTAQPLLPLLPLLLLLLLLLVSRLPAITILLTLDCLHLTWKLRAIEGAPETRLCMLQTSSCTTAAGTPAASASSTRTRAFAGRMKWLRYRVCVALLDLCLPWIDDPHCVLQVSWARQAFGGWKNLKPIIYKPFYLCTVIFTIRLVLLTPAS